MEPKIHILSCLNDNHNWSEVLRGIFCPLPVLPDAVQDDDEADVEDEVDSANNQVNNFKYKYVLIGDNRDDDTINHVEGKEAISESKICSNQFVVLHSYFMNFQAGTDETDCCTDDINTLCSNREI